MTYAPLSGLHNHRIRSREVGSQPDSMQRVAAPASHARARRSARPRVKAAPDATVGHARPHPDRSRGVGRPRPADGIARDGGRPPGHARRRAGGRRQDDADGGLGAPAPHVRAGHVAHARPGRVDRIAGSGARSLPRSARRRRGAGAGHARAPSPNGRWRRCAPPASRSRSCSTTSTRPMARSSPRCCTRSSRSPPRCGS